MSTPSTERRSRASMLRRFFLFPLLKVLVAFAVLFALALLVCEIGARHYERVAASLLTPESAILSQRPGSGFKEANASALKLEVLAASLGIDLVPKPQERPRPASGARKSFEEIKAPLKDYLTAANRRSDDLVMSVPAVVRSFLEKNTAALAAIRVQLESGEPPVWESDPTKGFDVLVPNLLGQMELHRLLLARAFVDVAEGRDAEALSWNDASWRLMEAAWGRVETISYLVALAEQRGSLQVLRLARAVPREPWRTRLEALDPLATYVRSVRYEALSAILTARDPKSTDFASFVWWLKPYLRAGLAEHAVREAKVARELAALGPCAASPEAIDTVWDKPWPRWNIPGKVAWPSMASAASRTAHRQLDLELLALILSLKEGEALENPYPSRACPGERWTWRRDATGHLLGVEFSYRPREVYNKDLWELPLRYVSRRSA